MPLDDKVSQKLNGKTPAVAKVVPIIAEPETKPILDAEAKALAQRIADQDNFPEWAAKKKNEFRKVVELVAEIESRGLDLTKNIDDWAEAAIGLSYFGEYARPLFYRLAKVKGNWPEYQHELEYDAALKEYQVKMRSSVRFMKLCSLFGLTLKQIQEEVKASSSIEDLTTKLKKRLPEGVNIEDYINYGFYEFQNCYYFDEGERGDTRMSNFVMSIKFLVRSKTNPKRVIELRNIYGHKELVEMPTETLVSISKFNICTQSEGNFLFEGKEQHLNKIKRKLFDIERASTEVDTLGWQPDAQVYAFANGIFNGCFTEVDEFGVVEHHDKHYFIPMFSKIYAYDHFTYENERKFIYKRSAIDFSQWAQLFNRVYGQNSFIAIPYLAAALFRDIVYRRLKFFPILNLFGQPGSGKSTMAISLMSLFGEGQEPFMLGGSGTPKAFMRKFAQYRNSLVWLDEYSNKIGEAKIESLKNIYDGTGYERAMMTQDNRTKTTPVNSACLLSGQELPTASPALFKRVILLKFAHAEWDHDAFNKLKSYEREGLSSLITELMKYRALVEEQFNQTFDACVKEIKLLLPADVEDRILKNSVLLLAFHKILNQEVTFPCTYDQLRDHLCGTIQEQTKLISTSAEIRKFWDVVEFLLRSGEIEEDLDFKFVNEFLFIQLQKIHPLYLECHNRQYGQRGLDKTSLIHYLEADRAYIETVKSTRFKGSNTSAMKFHYKLLGANLEKVDSSSYELEKGAQYSPDPTAEFFSSPETPPKF